jgi:urease accessory protein
MRAATPLDQPRALGRVSVSSKARADRSHIDGLHQAGALKVLFPRSRDRLQAIVINTAGGITGGDAFQIAARAGKSSELSLTTQAAERVYRAQPGQVGRLTTRLTVDDEASLHWLPQETILYDASALRRDLRVNLAATARFLMVEAVLFGRRAMGEEVNSLRFDDRIAIQRAGQSLYLDGVRLYGDAAPHLDRPAVAAGARAMASVVCVSPEAQAHLTAVRDLIGPAGGASLIGADLLVMRVLAEDGFSLRKCLLPLLDRLTQNQLPSSWRL